MMRLSRKLAAVLAPLSLSSGAVAHPTAHDAWQPTPAMVRDLELKVRLPATAEPLSTYARYYTGESISGRRVLKGYYLAGGVGNGRGLAKPGIYLRPSEVLVDDGGCDVITVFYDPQTKTIAGVYCNGFA